MSNLQGKHKDTLLQGYFISCFLSLVLILGICSVPGLSHSVARGSLSEWLQGQWAQRIEAQYDEDFALKSIGVNFWAAVDFLVFREGRSGLVVGRDGWLFSSEEFHRPLAAERSLAKNLEYVSWVKSYLERRGVELVVAPVPAKARIYAPYTGSLRPSAIHRDLYQRLLANLQVAGVSVFDSHQAMLLQSAPMFFRTDTHWTPAGARVVARGVARRVAQSQAGRRINHADLDVGHQRFTTERVATRTLQGDLMNFLPLSPWFDELLPATDQLAVYQTYRDSAGDLFAEPDVAPAVALVGTSYSANNDWNFAGALQQAMSNAVINFSASADGPFVPMANFIEKNLPKLQQVQLVVWEIPERYLLVDYAQKMQYSQLPPHMSADEQYMGLAQATQIR